LLGLKKCTQPGATGVYRGTYHNFLVINSIIMEKVGVYRKLNSVLKWETGGPDQ
jgi:hypothetical protein